MKRYLTLILTALITLGYAAIALAEWPARFEGRPYLFETEPTEAYYLWHDYDGVHLRVSSNGKPRVFSGSISTDGWLENIMVKSAGKRDYSRYNNSGKLQFRLTAANDTAGIDFTVRKGAKIKFDLELDGFEIDPGQIFMGAEGWNPNDSVFTIYYDEEMEREEDSHTTVILGLDWFGWLFGPPGHGPHHGPPPHGPRPRPRPRPEPRRP
jgi:hypothetical protein